MQFEVRYVDEEDLPTGQAWVIGITEEGDRFLFIKRGAAFPSMIEDAWRGGHLLNVDSGSIPAQRGIDLRVAV